MERLDLLMFGLLERLFRWTEERLGGIAGWAVCLAALAAVLGAAYLILRRTFA